MARIIVSGDVRSGDLLIDSNGVRSIASLEKPIRAHLKAIANLLEAVDYDPNPEDGVSQDLGLLVSKLSNLAVERLESLVGPLDAIDSVVYTDTENEFACSSNGAPPRRLNLPSATGNLPQEIAESRLLAPEVVDFLERAKEAGFGINDMFETPKWVAEAMGMKLSEMASMKLKFLAPSRLNSMTDLDRELVCFFHKVVADGRYVKTWSREPVAVAAAIGAELSNAVADRILGAHSVIARAPDIARVSIQQGITVGIVAIVCLNHPRDVVDRSLVEKF